VNRLLGQAERRSLIAAVLDAVVVPIDVADVDAGKGQAEVVGAWDVTGAEVDTRMAMDAAVAQEFEKDLAAVRKDTVGMVHAMSGPATVVEEGLAEEEHHTVVVGMVVRKGSAEEHGEVEAGLKDVTDILMLGAGKADSTAIAVEEVREDPFCVLRRAIEDRSGRK
ncbi:hypothetical protein HDV00_012289, partial [Rhizophlyctis rosea]